MKKTIYDIAEELEVAPSTVSKALNDAPGISKKMRERIKKYADKVRYFPNANAAKLKTKKSFSIGIVYSENLGIGLEHNFFSSILQKFKEYVESNGYEITFVISNLGNRKLSYYEFCQQKNIKGVFIVTSVPDNPYLKELIDSDVACVTTDIYFDNLYTVISDNINAGQKAVKFFYEKGFRHIAHIAGHHYSLAARERQEGFRKQMNEYNLPIRENEVIQANTYSFEDGYKSGELFLKQPNYSKAVFVVSDQVAMGFIKALQDNGVKVPEDVSVIGVDDLPFSKHYCPALTTIQQDTTKIGLTAAKKLIDMMKYKEANKKGITKIPVKIIERDSTI
ncbi:MAG: LacI family transcriptional regulator [Candidatus Izimaplasma sp.]|nr:LacI family transcriptional regulator [Candidatus Izimaplasma bacterium]